jgi:hypothetical protein
MEMITCCHKFECGISLTKTPNGAPIWHIINGLRHCQACCAGFRHSQKAQYPEKSKAIVWQLRDEFHKLDSEEAFDAKKKKKNFGGSRGRKLKYSEDIPTVDHAGTIRKGFNVGS